MSLDLHDLVDEILDVVFEGRCPTTPASIAAGELAAMLLTGGTTRADLVRVIAQLIIAVDAELIEREALRREAAARAAIARASAAGASPIARRWRTSPMLDQIAASRRPADVTAVLMGDPAPGRSALDQRTPTNRRI